MEQVKIRSCPNFRDLGGYKKKSGGFTRYSKIYRSDCLSKLVEEDIALISKHNIRCVIDLRFSNELEDRPNPLNGREGFEYYNVSLKDGLYSNNFDSYMAVSMGNMYISLIDEASGEIAQVFRILAEHEDCGTVFHCHAGKDRTGVIAAMILLLAGVSKEDIISNYAVSYELLKELIEIDLEKIKSMGIKIMEHTLLSEPENMEMFLSHLEEKYLSVENYLLKIGLTQSEINKVKNIL